MKIIIAEKHTLKEKERIKENEYLYETNYSDRFSRDRITRGHVFDFAQQITYTEKDYKLSDSSLFVKTDYRTSWLL